IALVGTKLLDGQLNGTDQCVNGLDNFGFVIGTSATLFNQGVIKAQGSLSGWDIFQDMAESVLSDFSETRDDVAQWRNPFYGWKNDTNKISDAENVVLIDGGEAHENLPLNAHIKPERQVDLAIGFDATSNTNNGWPNGTSLYVTYNRTMHDDDQISFANVPTPEQFVAQGLNTRPTFFGCNSSDVTNYNESRHTPIIAYIPNYPYVGAVNTSSFKLEYDWEEASTLMKNAEASTSLNGLVKDGEWKRCLACGLVDRARERNGIDRSEECQTCFNDWCWNGEQVDTSDVSKYEPEIPSVPQFVQERSNEDPLIQPNESGKSQTFSGSAQTVFSFTLLLISVSLAVNLMRTSKASDLPIDILLSIFNHLDKRTTDTLTDKYRKLNYQLSAVNKHWSEALTHSHIYSSAVLKLQNDVDAQRLKSWMASPRLKSKKTGQIFLIIENKDIYNKLCEDSYGLVDLNVSRFSVVYHINTREVTLPRNLNAKYLFINGGDQEAILRPACFSKELRSSLKHIMLNNVSFEFFTGLDMLNFCFEKVQSFVYDLSIEWVRGPSTLAFILRLMPNLKLLKVDAREQRITRSPREYREVNLPDSMDRLESLTLNRIYADISNCRLAKLRNLCYWGFADISQWHGLGDQLRNVQLPRSVFSADHDIFAPEFLSKLKNVRKFSIEGYYSPVFSDMFNKGHFDFAMPLLEELNICSRRHNIKLVALNRFINLHSKLHTVIALKCNELLPSKISANLENFVAQDDDILSIYDDIEYTEIFEATELLDLDMNDEFDEYERYNEWYRGCDGLGLF
ncbi:hypothetical protein E3P94_04109, partial [Wallemia ichthyophaga]